MRSVPILFHLLQGKESDALFSSGIVTCTLATTIVHVDYIGNVVDQSCEFYTIGPV